MTSQVRGPTLSVELTSQLQADWLVMEGTLFSWWEEASGVFLTTFDTPACPVTQETGMTKVSELPKMSHQPARASTNNIFGSALSFTLKVLKPRFRVSVTAVYPKASTFFLEASVFGSYEYTYCSHVYHVLHLLASASYMLGKTKCFLLAHQNKLFLMKKLITLFLICFFIVWC